MEKRYQRFSFTNTFLILIFLIGLGVLLYPNISDYINRKNSSSAIVDYDEAIKELDEKRKDEILTSAEEYNKEMAKGSNQYADISGDKYDEYMSLLNINDKGMMGYIEIKKLGVNTPIYHTTDEDVLQKYIGHVENSSLPIGGVGTHAVLSGHRGLPSAILFTHLDEMEIGDVFSIIVLGKKLNYVVDQIKVVLPGDDTYLAIDPNEDYVTLITCTPYGVNTHRLLVRGVRVTDEEAEAVLKSQTKSHKWTKEEVVNAVATGMSCIFGILLLLLFFGKKEIQKMALRPWDETILDVFDAATVISEYATRPNWVVDDVVQASDWFNGLKQWEEKAPEDVRIDYEEDSRKWKEYGEVDWDRTEEEIMDAEVVDETEEDNIEEKEWDNDILDKVEDDWTKIDNDYYHRVIKYLDIDKNNENDNKNEEKDVFKETEDKERAKDLDEKIQRRNREKGQ